MRKEEGQRLKVKSKGKKEKEKKKKTTTNLSPLVSLQPFK